MFDCNYVCAYGLYAHATQILFLCFLLLLLCFSSCIFTKVLLNNLLMLSWHWGNRCAACRNTSEALAVLLGRSINSGDVSLNLKCPVFWWMLAIRPCQEVAAFSAGRTLPVSRRHAQVLRERVGSTDYAFILYVSRVVYWNCPCLDIVMT